MNKTYNRINIRTAALEALEAFLNPPRRKPAAAYAVRTGSGLAGYSMTDTGAFRVLYSLPERERSDAKIYDDDGYLLYR